jgi:hypothetical protein
MVGYAGMLSRKVGVLGDKNLSFSHDPRHVETLARTIWADHYGKREAKDLPLVSAQWLKYLHELTVTDVVERLRAL